MIHDLTDEQKMWFGTMITMASTGKKESNVLNQIEEGFSLSETARQEILKMLENPPNLDYLSSLAKTEEDKIGMFAIALQIFSTTPNDRASHILDDFSFVLNLTEDDVFKAYIMAGLS
ncbi:MAG: hypothetical protein H7A23_08765 [Leptospiraceae bacterium]|nr:hypothetical protein [Leptospiraceae bacterium]MCP5494637.1 hypothetical protein [Leptospiraceae bacterium]